MRGIHRGPVNSPHKWPVTRKMFPFDDVIMSMGHIYRLSMGIRILFQSKNDTSRLFLTKKCGGGAMQLFSMVISPQWNVNMQLSPLFLLSSFYSKWKYDKIFLPLLNVPLYTQYDMQLNDKYFFLSKTSLWCTKILTLSGKANVQSTAMIRKHRIVWPMHRMKKSCTVS